MLMKGNEAILVARHAIEVDCGGYLKRYWVEAPLFE